MVWLHMAYCTIICRRLQKTYCLVYFIAECGQWAELNVTFQKQVIIIVFLNDSFVAGQKEITDLNDKISDITQKITSLKFEVIHMMEESYVKFNILHQETVHLESKVKALSNDMNEILRRVETQVCMYSHLMILGQVQRLYIINGMLWGIWGERIVTLF